MRPGPVVAFGQLTSPTLAILTVLLGVPLCAGEADAGTVRLAAAKTSILVDEPLMVTVTFSGFRDVYLGNTLAKDNQYFAVLIDRGTGYSLFSRKVFVSTWFDPPARMPLKGRSLIWDIPLSYDATLGDWASPSRVATES